MTMYPLFLLPRGSETKTIRTVIQNHNYHIRYTQNRLKITMIESREKRHEMMLEALGRVMNELHAQWTETEESKLDFLEKMRMDTYWDILQIAEIRTDRNNEVKLDDPFQ